MSKLNYTLADVELIMEEYIRSEYRRLPIVNDNTPDHVWLAYRNEEIEKFKLKDPQLFGYIYYDWGTEDEEGWKKDSSQGDFEEDISYA
jgi:hypothetical protein